MADPERTALATLGGLVKPPPSLARGTPQAAFSSSLALIALGRYAPVHVYHEAPDRVARGVDGVFAPPPHLEVTLQPRAGLPFQTGRYRALYAVEGELQSCVPHALRPFGDWVPVIAETGTTHHRGQWANLFLAAASGLVRSTDGLVLKSTAHARVLEESWARWRETGISTSSPPRHTVIPNGVDTTLHRRDERAGRATRNELGIATTDVVFICFTRLSPGTKGDLAALVALWRHVVTRCPQALLLLSGATVDRRFETSLLTTARLAGVGNRVALIANPYDLWPEARSRLLSAADAFVHLTTGVEEACPQVILQAMAHGLPVIASDWAGIRDVIVPGENGLLVRTVAAPSPLALGEAHWGRTTEGANPELGRSAACDPREIVNQVLALAGSAERRLQLGAQARRSIEEHSTLAAAARRKLAFMDALSREAEAAWPAEASGQRTLVDLDRVLAIQASGQLTPASRIRLRDRDALSWLPEWREPPARRLLAAMVEALAGGAPTFAELASQLAGAEDSPERRALGGLLVRLLGHGVVEIE